MALPPLHKYLSLQGAMLTLENQTFRHAKPSDFNDTQDMTIQSIFPEATEVALEKLSENIPDVILKRLGDPWETGKPAVGILRERPNTSA
jgi:hypothetical protein